MRVPRWVRDGLCPAAALSRGPSLNLSRRRPFDEPLAGLEPFREAENFHADYLVRLIEVHNDPRTDFLRLGDSGSLQRQLCRVHVCIVFEFDGFSFHYDALAGDQKKPSRLSMATR